MPVMVIVAVICQQWRAIGKRNKLVFFVVNSFLVTWRRSTNILIFVSLLKKWYTHPPSPLLTPLTHTNNVFPHHLSHINTSHTATRRRGSGG
jgi:hypothetical protein